MALSPEHAATNSRSDNDGIAHFILAKQNHQDLGLAKRSHRDEFVNIFHVLCAICPII